MGKGSRFINRAYLLDRELMDAYAVYKMCVTYVPFTLESKDTRTTKSFPTGYSFLPYPGSLMDQPYRLMEYFSCFMNGEKAAFYSR
jgi:hypothetical protein